MNKYDSPLVLHTENSISLIIEQIRPNSTVLEFGPATGRMTNYLSNNLGCNVYIVEIDKEAFDSSIKFAKGGLCDDIENYKWLDIFKDVNFDYIIFADVLEHLVNPQNVLLKSKDLLANGGCIISSIPNIAHNSIIIDLINNKFNYTKTGILDSTHLRFFTYYSLQQLFNDCDLVITNEQLVRLDYEQLEIENANMNIPTELANILKNRDFAYVYQYVFTAVKKNYYINNRDKTIISKAIKEDGQGIPLMQSIFLDKGMGFNEINKILKQTVLNDKKFNLYIDLSKEIDIKGVRFDPCEYACRIKISNMVTNLDDVVVIPENASKKENGYDVFMHKDPIYLIKSENIDKIEFLNISGEIDYLTKGEIFDYYSISIEEKNTENILLSNKYNDQLNILKDEIQKIIVEKEELILEKQELISEKIIKDKIVSEKEQELSSLQYKFDHCHSEMDQEINTYKNIVFEKNMQLQNCEYEMNILKNQLEYIYKSSSWKITKPLRFLNRAKIKIENIFKSTFTSEKHLILTDSNPDKKSKFCNVKVSVIIPTYNGEQYILELIRTINSQKGIEKIEIIVVDSGSIDSTVNICEENGILPIKIKQEEFSHSYARNLGASKSNGNYILFMTQDALPSNEYWIYNMLTPIIKHKVVAVSCVEKPREDCELAYYVESTNFAKYLGVYNSDKIGSLPKNLNFETLRKNGQLNDVSCLISKPIFDEFKYLGDYAEDLDLGVRLIKSGYKIAILSSEKVIHSHNRACGYYLKRSMVDSKNLKKILPDFPIPENNISCILDATIFAYYKTICLLDYLESENFEGQTPKVLFDSISEYWQKISYIKSVPKDNMQYGKIYSDNIVDKFMKDINVLYECDNVMGDYLLGHIIHFINNTLSPFVVKRYFVVDKWLKNQIIDTIFKRFVSVCGNEISLYMISHPLDTKLGNLIYELQKGV